ncbi:MAG: stage II sporulation protein M [Treponema sp.]|nr:stage II sporulation protein M [Treponema sp.]
MTQAGFITRREKLWKEFEIIVRGGKEGLTEKASWFPLAYREITQDLNTARAHGFDPSIIDRLNSLVLDASQILYSRRSWSLKSAADFMIRVFPRAVRSKWRSLAASLLIFYGLAFFFGFLCVRNPSFIYQIAGEDTITNLEEMYNPESPHFLEPRDVSGDADMFGFYIYNNISIAFRTFAGGILAGFGSLVILCFNGAFLGAVAGHIINVGFKETFFPFIIGHSSFELTAIVLSAQGGLLLGYGLFFTKGRSRSASIKAAGKTALPIITGAAIMLFVAACIEAFWSSRHEYPAELRYGVGALGWLLVILYFVFAGRRNTNDKSRVYKE